jgi:hypothetical protein
MGRITARCVAYILESVVTLYTEKRKQLATCHAITGPSPQAFRDKTICSQSFSEPSGNHSFGDHIIPENEETMPKNGVNDGFAPRDRMAAISGILTT